MESDGYLGLGPLIIAIDDDPVALKAVEMMLRKYGYRYLLCSGAQEALESLNEFAPLVAICDYDMPDLDGLSLFRRARSIRSYLRGILLSGAVTHEILTATVESGFDDCLLKPVKPEDLFQALQRSVIQAKHWQMRYEKLDGR
jgi:CheY-like chemotaxis protein